MIDLKIEVDTSCDPDQTETDEYGAEDVGENERPGGSILGVLCWSWRDIQQARLAAEQRGLKPLAADLLKIENRLANQAKKELRRQPAWPWLSQYPGLGGVQVARLLVIIGDPRRFPGQPCTAGHYSPPTYAIGDPCPILKWVDGGRLPCDGTMLAPRPHTGTRSLWHYLGLHAVDGHSPRKTKGHQADWNPIGRTVCLQPGGIAEQIVRLRVPKYREIYDATKARLTQERGIVPVAENEDTLDPAQTEGAESDGVIDESRGSLRPIQIEGIARKVAVKAFVADLLTEMKRLADSHGV